MKKFSLLALLLSLAACSSSNAEEDGNENGTEPGAEAGADDQNPGGNPGDDDAPEDDDGGGFDVDGDGDIDITDDDVFAALSCARVDWTADGQSFAAENLANEADFDAAAGVLFGGVLSLGAVQVTQLTQNSLNFAVAIDGTGTFTPDEGDVEFRDAAGSNEEFFVNEPGAVQVQVDAVSETRVSGSFSGTLVSETDGREIALAGTFEMFPCTE